MDIVSHSNDKNGPQDKMPSELDMEGEGHRVLPSSDDPQPMTSSSFSSTLTKPSERESSDSKEPRPTLPGSPSPSPWLACTPRCETPRCSQVLRAPQALGQPAQRRRCPR